MLKEASRPLVFGSFRLEPATRQLLHGSAPVPLTPRGFDLLHALIVNRHRVMEKDELLREVWSDAAVEEGNLSQHVFLLRKALGDSSDEPRFIATIPRRGYRFVGDVREAGAGPQPRRRVPAASVAVAAALIVGVAAFSRTAWNTPRVEPPTFRPLTFRHQGFDRARFTPDGRRVVLDARWDGDTSRVYIMPSDDPVLRPLPQIGARVVRVSASGQMAVLLEKSKTAAHDLAVVPIDGGEPRRVADDVDAADWAAEIDQFAIVRRVDGRSIVEFPIGTPLYETSAWLEALKIAPARDAVAFLEHPAARDTRGFVTVVDRQRRRQVVSRDWAAVFGLVWQPGGHEIWFGRSDGRVNAIGAADRSGRERDLYRGPDGFIVQDIAADGRVLAAQFTFHGAVAWRQRRTLLERDLALFNLTRAVAIAADGQAILMTAEDQGSDWTTYATYLQRADTPSPIRLGEGNAQGLSPDGRWALALDYRAPAHLVLLSTAGGPPRDIPPGPVVQIHQAQWLPDGQRVVFAGSEPGGGVRLYVQAVSGGAPAAITPDGYGLDPNGVSPDGRFVVCPREGKPSSRCFVSGAAPEPIRGLESGEQIARWSRDGRVLYVYRRTAAPLRIDALNAQSGERTLWRNFPPPGLAPARDVRQLFLADDPETYAYNHASTSNDLYLIEGLR